MTDLESHDDSSDRLQYLINVLKMNGLQFSKAIGVSQAFVSFMIKGKSKISRGTLDKIGKKFPSVNIHWLLTGEGEMFMPEPLKKEISAVQEPDIIYNKSDNTGLSASWKDDDYLRKNLGSNLKVLTDRWGMKKNELFSLLMPGAKKQTVSNYFAGDSAPPLWVLIHLEQVTGIKISAWLTRAVLPDELPAAPLKSDARGNDDPISMIRKELRALLERLGG